MKPIHRLFTSARSAIAALGASLLLGGCAQGGGELGYYWQSVSGHLQLMWAADAMDDWIARPSTPPALRERLRLAQRARTFAVQELHLPDNPSYRRYADLKRSSAVWNVVAAPPYSLQLHTWCFPVLGCVGYRGYFSRADARAEADLLAAQGLEVDVYGVPAYSTLGAMNWLGGDPLLSTFVHWPEGDFVRLLFHELAHQKVYAEGDTLFNESFATAVGRIGSAQWLRTQASAAARSEAAASDARREAFRQLTRETRAQLEAIYASNSAPAQNRQALEAMKTEAMKQFRERYAALAATWPAAQRAGYDHWVATANNASFGAQAAYDEWVPAFETLFEQSARNWPRFYDAVKALADQSAEQRHTALRALLAPPTPAAKEPSRA
ncbi:MAG: aminopeptidase [Simplicispira suum]|uniref:aminopeptidase n=1 Tax=Simplicispira suum TaxID=2109915 RepID=UPI001C6BB5FD|nr:aminopeptidase [Simplicispira suum]MBW7833755.1 aminopeptidase [Simplicispira suum]